MTLGLSARSGRRALKRTSLRAAMALAMLGAFACGGGGGGDATGPPPGGGGGGGGGGGVTGDVTATANTFSPMEFTVRVGNRVLWANNDNVEHTVTSDNNAFPRGQLSNRGSTYSVTFGNLGDFPYHCEFHGAPGVAMHGTIHVVP